MKNWAKEIQVIGPTIDTVLWTIAEIQRLSIPVKSIAKTMARGEFRVLHSYKRKKTELVLCRLDHSTYVIQSIDHSKKESQKNTLLYLTFK